MPENEIQTLVEREEAKSMQRLESLMREFPDDTARIRVLHLKGRPAPTIIRRVEEEKIDTLVMGTVARVDIAGFFIGNTAETILSRVTCSVLAVKPEGFVTPVTLNTVPREAALV
jgi:nucleotide-binding universal stress UspA family protein